MRRVQLRERQGAERFQFRPRSQARSLKKQFQTAGVPAAQRVGPLVFAGQQLVYVPGLGMDARVLDGAKRDRVSIQWVPEPLV
jgi:tRNA(Ile)-lysidine synthase